MQKTVIRPIKWPYRRCRKNTPYFRAPSCRGYDDKSIIATPEGNRSCSQTVFVSISAANPVCLCATIVICHQHKRGALSPMRSIHKAIINFFIICRIQSRTCHGFIIFYNKKSYFVLNLSKNRLVILWEWENNLILAVASLKWQQGRCGRHNTICLDETV